MTASPDQSLQFEHISILHLTVVAVTYGSVDNI